MRKYHLEIAHFIWSNHLKIGDTVIDATCGNGHDSLFLGQCILSPDQGRLICIDIQEKAILATQKALQNQHPLVMNRIEFILGSHEDLPSVAPSLIVYNFGYLPSSDKVIKTQVDSSMQSLKSALSILRPRGLISVTLYPGHKEGKEELQATEVFSRSLDPMKYKTLWIASPSHPLHPQLLLIESLADRKKEHTP